MIGRRIVEEVGFVANAQLASHYTATGFNSVWGFRALGIKTGDVPKLCDSGIPLLCFTQGSRVRDAQIGALGIELHGAAEREQRVIVFALARIHASEACPNIRIVRRDGENLEILLLRLREISRPAKHACMPCLEIQIVWRLRYALVDHTQRGGPVVCVAILAYLDLPFQLLLLRKRARGEDAQRTYPKREHLSARTTD